MLNAALKVAAFSRLLRSSIVGESVGTARITWKSNRARQSILIQCNNSANRSYADVNVQVPAGGNHDGFVFV